jgi:hypothetical protein
MEIDVEGSWINSSKNINLENNVLSADLRNSHGNWIKNKIFVEFNKHYDNCDGAFYGHCKHHTNNGEKNKWCVLLTTAIKVHDENENETNYRKQLYLEQLQKWIDNTNYTIFIVESTGNGIFFDEIANQYSDRIRLVPLKLEKSTSSSFLEAKSIKEVMHFMQTTTDADKFTHILKVTGRYFLNNIQCVLENTVQGADVYVQIHTNHDIRWQHTEYYGIKKELLLRLAEDVIQTVNFFEKSFYSFIVSNNLKISVLGPFKNNIKRGGDKLVLEDL